MRASTLERPHAAPAATCEIGSAPSASHTTTTLEGPPSIIHIECIEQNHESVAIPSPPEPPRPSGARCMPIRPSASGAPARGAGLFGTHRPYSNPLLHLRPHATLHISSSPARQRPRYRAPSHGRRSSIQPPHSILAIIRDSALHRRHQPAVIARLHPPPAPPLHKFYSPEDTVQ